MAKILLPITKGEAKVLEAALQNHINLCEDITENGPLLFPQEMKDAATGLVFSRRIQERMRSELLKL